MDFHPSQIPAVKVFDVPDEKTAAEAAAEMVEAGFEDIMGGYRVLMPKERRLAKRIGYTITTTVTYGLKRAGRERNIRYWTYHEDADHYAIVLVDARVLEGLVT